jgi:hypothetical protein
MVLCYLAIQELLADLEEMRDLSNHADGISVLKDQLDDLNMLIELVRRIIERLEESIDEVLGFAHLFQGNEVWGVKFLSRILFLVSHDLLDHFEGLLDETLCLRFVFRFLKQRNATFLILKPSQQQIQKTC